MSYIWASLATGKTASSQARVPISLRQNEAPAKRTSDPEVVGLTDKVLADDWVNLEPDRRGPGKPEMMELLRRLYRDKESFPKPYPDMQQRDLQVFLFGNTAVATYFQEDTAKPDRRPLDVTDVFGGRNLEAETVKGESAFSAVMVSGPP